MVAPAVRAGSPVGGEIVAAATSATLTKPTGTASGDVILFHVAFTNASLGTITLPAGFAAITGIPSPASTGTSSAVTVWKLATGSEPASYPLSWTTGSSGEWVGLAVSGADPSTWLDASAQLVGSSAGSAHALPSVDPTVSESLLLAFVASDNSGAAGVAVTYSLGSSGLVKVRSEVATPNTATALALFATLSSESPTGVRTVVPSVSTRYVGSVIAVKATGAPVAINLRNSAEGSPGNDVLATAGAAGNTGGASGDYVDGVTGDVRFSNTSPVPMTGSWHYKMSQPTSSQAKLMWNAGIGSLSSQWWLREYVVITNTPAVNILIIQARGLNEDPTPILQNSFNVRLHTTRNLQLVDSTGTSRYTSATPASGLAGPLPLNTLIRLEYHVVQAVTTGHFECRAFWSDGTSGHGPHSTVPTFTLGNLTDNWNTHASTSEINVGIMTAATGNTHYVDEVAVSTVGWIGPVPTVSLVTPWRLTLPGGALQAAVLYI